MNTGNKYKVGDHVILVDDLSETKQIPKGRNGIVTAGPFIFSMEHLGYYYLVEFYHRKSKLKINYCLREKQLVTFGEWCGLGNKLEDRKNRHKFTINNEEFFAAADTKSGRELKEIADIPLYTKLYLKLEDQSIPVPNDTYIYLEGDNREFYTKEEAVDVDTKRGVK